MNPRAAAGRIRSAVARLSACLACDRRMVAELVVWRISLPVLKRLISVETLVKRMAPPAPSSPHTIANRVEQIRQVVGSGGRLLVSANCLERSLVFYRLLLRAGAAPVLVLGMRRDGSTLKGHAWVALDGEPFEVSEDHYTPVVAFGSTAGVHRRTEHLPVDAPPPL